MASLDSLSAAQIAAGVRNGDFTATGGGPGRA